MISVKGANLISQHVYVDYRKGMTLRIPLGATNKGSSPSSSRIKITYSSVKDLVSLTKEYAVSCPTIQQLFTQGCLTKNKQKLKEFLS